MHGVPFGHCCDEEGRLVWWMQHSQVTLGHSPKHSSTAPVQLEPALKALLLPGLIHRFLQRQQMPLEMVRHSTRTPKRFELVEPQQQVWGVSRRPPSALAMPTV